MFETKISKKSLIFYFAPSLGLLLLWVRIIFSKSNDYGFGIFVTIIAILIFTYSIKKIQLTEKALIIRRPLWLFKRNDVYMLEKISKIKLKFENTRLSGGPKLIVIGNNLNEDYSIYLFKEDLKEFVHQLEIRNLEIEKDKYFENQLK